MRGHGAPSRHKTERGNVGIIRTNHLYYKYSSKVLHVNKILPSTVVVHMFPKKIYISRQTLCDSFVNYDNVVAYERVTKFLYMIQ